MSVSTVNRVIGDAGSVRSSTREQVLAAAEDIGFYGIGTIEHAIQKNRQTCRLGILLHQGSRAFYRSLGNALEVAARSHAKEKAELTLEFLDDLSPDNVARRLMALADTCETVGLVAAEHPLVSEAIDAVLARGVPVTGLIAPLSARGNVGFVGLDNWKVGRTAAWAFSKMCGEPGEIGILFGNARYRNQELNESGFRSYFREHDRGFRLLEPLATYETAAVAREMTERLFSEHPNMRGLFISGGGITGALAAVREARPREDFVCIGYELFEITRAALIDGTLTMVIAHPLTAFANAAITTMVKATRTGPDAGAQTVMLGFEIYTSENI